MNKTYEKARELIQRPQVEEFAIKNKFKIQLSPVVAYLPPLA